MTITFTDGTHTTSTSEDTLSEVTANAHFAFWIHLHNMASGDTFRIKVYVRDSNAGTDRLYLIQDVSGAQSSPAFYQPYVTTKKHKVTIQKTAGTNRAVTWERIEVT